MKKKICIIWSSSGVWSALSEYYKNQWNIVHDIHRKQRDLSKEYDITQLCTDISQEEYDIVIFSAGVWYHRSFESLMAHEISEQIFVNTFAPLQLIHSLWKDTKFVYLSSIMQYIPAKNMSVYSGMKRATSQTLKAIRLENPSRSILDIDLGAVKTPMHIKAGMKKSVWKNIETVIPKLVYAIENKHGSTTLFWDWWLMIYIIFPLMRVFLLFKK